jgi:predicted ATPase/DNA-binding CsgD family transcriptional regulator/DNA-binding XRE family transcriptional regulator
MQNPVPPDVPDRIMRLRKRLGLTQAGLAALLSVSHVAVNRWERGHASPSAARWAGIERIEAEAGLPRAGSLGGAAERGAAPPPAQRRSNLPTAVDRFIGRGQELAEIAGLLREARLITITGAGGVGKTRLAIEAAFQLESVAPDGVWLVELGALADPALTVQAVAAVLGVREQPGRSLLDVLAATLRSGSTLLVLDNCEHLLAACADLAGSLLRVCPRLCILATSREALNIEGEARYPLAPLDVGDGSWVWRGETSPVPRQPAPNTQHQPPAAVDLFVERGRGRRPGFELTEHNADDVTVICRRLDGLPLAIELAAARLSVLSVREIAARLDQRFRLLTGGSRAAPPRHQTLRAMVEWSYVLLDAPERRVFDALAVFAGSFGVEAVESICPEGTTLDALSRLVDASLVMRDEVNGESRLRLLETLREYARERLQAAGVAEQALRRHAMYFLDLVERAGPQPGMTTWPKSLDWEQENLRAALRWFRDAGETEPLMRLATAMSSFWVVHGYLSEGRRWLEAALTAAGSVPSVLGAKADYVAAMLAMQQGDYRAARNHAGSSLELSREVDDQASVATALNALALIAFETGDYVAQRDACYEMLLLLRRKNDPTREGAGLLNLGIAEWALGDYASALDHATQAQHIFEAIGQRDALINVRIVFAAVAHAEGDDVSARVMFEECLAALRAMDYKYGMAVVLDRLAHVERRLGHSDVALELLAESLSIRTTIGARQGLIEGLRSLAVLLAPRHPRRAAVLLGSADALAGPDGVPVFVMYRPDHERAVATMREALGDGGFTVAIADGARTAAGQAIADALHEAGQRIPRPTAQHRESAPASVPPPAPAGLSGRELEVLRLIAVGASNKAIALQLTLSVRTVERHVANAYAKIGARSRAEAVAYAHRHGLAGNG